MKNYKEKSSEINHGSNTGRIGESMELLSKTGKNKRDQSKIMRSSISEDRGEALMSSTLTNKN